MSSIPVNIKMSLITVAAGIHVVSRFLWRVSCGSSTAAQHQTLVMNRQIHEGNNWMDGEIHEEMYLNHKSCHHKKMMDELRKIAFNF